MIDAERMLGSLVRNALDQGGKRGKRKKKWKKNHKMPTSLSMIVMTKKRVVIRPMKGSLTKK